MSDKPNNEPLPLAKLVVESRLPLAFVRLAIDCGFRLQNGRASPVELTLWLADHYKDIRAAAGLPALPETTSRNKQKRANVKVGNFLRTVLDYQASRSSDPHIKRACRVQSRRVERTNSSDLE